MVILLTHIDNLTRFPATVKDFTLKSTPVEQIIFLSWHGNHGPLSDTYCGGLLRIEGVIYKPHQKATENKDSKRVKYSTQIKL